jgi:myo-inositol-1(or 4)-monophosphatase
MPLNDAPDPAQKKLSSFDEDGIMSFPLDQTQELTAFAGLLADAAARASLAYFRRDIAVSDKGGCSFDPVTQADTEAESAIRALITATYPDHGILGEEGGHANRASPYCWVIDPIDGTRAYIAGIPLWTTLIALSFEGRPLIGIIDQPYLGERFIGNLEGAWLIARSDKLALATRDTVALKDAIFSTTSPDLFESVREQRILSALNSATRLTRYGCDAYAYALIAAGRIDLVVETGLKPWDVQALIPVLQGAGGVIANFDGEPVMEGGSIVAAANEPLLRATLELIDKIG